MTGLPTKPPYSEPSEPVEYVATTAGRIACDSCGEWIYMRRPVDGDMFAFPPECQVCGAPLQETGEVIIWPGTSLSDVMEIVLDLGIDPAEVTVSATTLRVKP